MDMNGVPVFKSDLLPISKLEAMCLPKDAEVVREFFLDPKRGVWGYFDKKGTEYKIYLSQKEFDKLKNADLTTNIND